MRFVEQSIEIECLYISLAILTIGIYAAVSSDDPEEMKQQLKDAAVHAQAAFPEPYHTVLMEKIGERAFRDDVEQTRQHYHTEGR